jgi:hypothetical protein
MIEADIKVGSTYTSSRWKGDRKVIRLVRQKDSVVVRYIDQRTAKSGNSALNIFASSAQGAGLVANT